MTNNTISARIARYIAVPRLRRRRRPRPGRHGQRRDPQPSPTGPGHFHAPSVTAQPAPERRAGLAQPPRYAPPAAPDQRRLPRQLIRLRHQRPSPNPPGRASLRAVTSCRGPNGVVGALRSRVARSTLS